MKKILGLTVAALMVMGLIGGGTWAYFTDPEATTGNILSAGTLDLRTNDANGVSATLFAQNLKPGDYFPAGANATIALSNAGSIDGGTLDITVTYVETDNATLEAAISGDTDLNIALTDDQYAAGLEIITLNYGGTNLLTSIPLNDNNGNGRVDMQDLKTASGNLTGLAGILTTTPKDFKVRVQLHDSGGNDNAFMADGITVTLNFILNQ